MVLGNFGKLYKNNFFFLKAEISIFTHEMINIVCHHNEPLTALTKYQSFTILQKYLNRFIYRVFTHEDRVPIFLQNNFNVLFFL